MKFVFYEWRKLFGKKLMLALLFIPWIAAQFFFSQSERMKLAELRQQYSEEWSDIKEYSDKMEPGEAIHWLNTELDKKLVENSFSGDAYFIQEYCDQLNYVSEYGNYVNHVINQAAQMEKIYAARNQKGYVIENIKKTGRDFQTLVGLEIDRNPPFWVKDAVFWDNGVWFLLMQVMILNLVLFGIDRESETGQLIHMQYRGRRPVMVAKVLVMLQCTIMLVLSMYGGFLLQAFFKEGGGNLQAPIQSFRECQKCVFLLNCRQFLLVYLLFVTIALLFVEGLLGVLILVFRALGGVAVFSAFFFGSYLLHKHLPENSIFLALRDFNVYRLTFPAVWMSTYKNVNFFDFAYGYADVFMFMSFFGIAVSISLLIMLAGRDQKEPNLLRFPWVTGKMHNLYVRCFRVIWCRINMLCHQAYELLFCGKRWFVLGSFLLLALFLNDGKRDTFYDLQKATYNSYMNALSGDYTEKTEKYLIDESLFLNGLGTRWELLEEKYEKEMISVEEYETEYMIMEKEQNQKKDGFKLISEQWEYIKTKKDSDLTLGFFNEYMADLLFQDKQTSLNQALLVICVAIFLLLSYNLEELESDSFLCSAMHGRKKRILIRMAVNCCLLLFAGCLLYGHHLINILFDYGEQNWTISSAAVRQLAMMPPKWSVGAVAIFYFLIKLLGTVQVGITVTSVSMIRSNKILLYCLAGLILLLPMFFLKAGFLYQLGGIGMLLCPEYATENIVTNAVPMMSVYSIFNLLIFSLLLYRRVRGVS